MSETTRLGDYEILDLLGSGGMGRVYKVRNVITDRIEAMKVLLPEIAGREEIAARFLREIKVLAALNHPNIAALHTALTIDNQLVMIMEYVEGQPLSAVLARGPIPPAEALSYMDQILDALSFAHQRHVIHRDIKPANMMLCADGSVKLMDFGIARTDDDTGLTTPGSTLGSMNYMSPEQVKGEKTDERSDLYSLGISLYELVTATRPFQGDTSYSLMAAHVNQPPRPPIELQPDMPAGLNDIILTSIAKSPADRFQSADAFRHAVKTVLRELQEGKTVVQASYEATPGSRTPLPQVRTGPITRPKPAVNTTAPIASKLGAVPTAPTTPVSSAPRISPPTPVPAASVASAPAPAPTIAVAPSAPAPSSPMVAPAAVVPAPQAAAPSNRGLYIALGAIAVLVVLLAAGLYIPKSRKAAAAQDAAPPVQQSAPAAQPQQAAANQSSPASVAGAQSQPAATTPAETQPTESAASSSPSSAVPAKSLTARNEAPRLPKQSAPVPRPESASAAADKAAAAEKAKLLDELEHDIDQLTSRAGAVNSSLETLKRQQGAMGLGLRGDMAAHQSSMNLNLSKAQDAIAHNDAERARRFADKAAADIDALEKFLGR